MNFLPLDLMLLAVPVLLAFVPGRRGRGGNAPTAAIMAAGDAGESKVAGLTRAMRGVESIPAFAFRTRDRNGRVTTCQVDHLVRGADRLWVLEVKNWAGTVSAPLADAQEWAVTTRAGQVSMRWNPLRQARRQCTLLAKETGVRADALVVMTGRCTTDGSPWPAGVVTLVELEDALDSLVRRRHSGGASPRAVAKAWEKARRMGAQDASGGVSGEHGRRVEGLRVGRKARILPALAAVGVLAVWWWLRTTM